MLILGIDEAGRGPVLGPLVICGYLVDKKNMAKLKKTGVRDSKQLSPTRRSRLAPELKKIANDFTVIKISAEEIDNMRATINLNRIEIEKMREIIDALQPDKVIVDSLERNTERFISKLGCSMPVVAENFADRKYPVVSAASVIAKVARDAEIAKLHKKHGNIGSGYPSDERTVRFLNDCMKKNKGLPYFVRKSWLTVERMTSEREQKEERWFR